MKNRTLTPCLMLALALAALAGPALSPEYFSRRFPEARHQPSALAQTTDRDSIRERLDGLYGELPLRFEANLGQSGEAVRFIARGSGYSLFLTSTEAVLALRNDNASPSHNRAAVLRMTLAGSAADPLIEGVGEAPGRTSYLTGDDAGKWRINVPSFNKVKYRGVYPGIDLVYYGNQRRLEYDFIVAPGADPAAITLDYRGADEIELDESGDLLLHTVAGQVRQRRPVIYQEAGGERVAVRGGYLLKTETQVGFELAGYDTARPLIIDPVLVYSTLAGGNDEFREIDRAGDKGLGIALDGAGNAYITGETFSSDFPEPSPVQAAHGGAFRDAFVAKLNPSGTALVYSTYLGGSRNDSGRDIAVDTLGQASVTGSTRSPNFPTANALQPTSNLDTELFIDKAFVARLNASGTGLIFSTYLAGDGFSSGEGIATDISGNVYVTGSAEPNNFPFTPGAFHSSGDTGGMFVTKLNPSGSALIYSAFVGGAFPISLALDSSGSAYVTGSAVASIFPTTPGSLTPASDIPFSAFVTKLNPAGSALAYSTFLEPGVRTTGIAVDGSGSAYVAGGANEALTTPATFATFIGTGGAGVGFVLKLDPAGSALVYSTSFGGNNIDFADDVAVDGAGNAYTTGLTASPDFPLADPLQTREAFIFVAKLNPTGTAFIYSTFFGGSVVNEFEQGTSIAVDRVGNAYFTGIAEQPDFPTTPGAFQSDKRGITDAFVAKIASFGACIQDESSGDILLFDPVTGHYLFTSCPSGVTLGGTGKIGRRGCLLTLEDQQGDRRVSANLDTCLNKATASVQSFAAGRTFVLTDRNTSDNACRCR